MDANNMILIAICSLAVICTVGLIWSLVCNNRTCKQRIEIINWVYDGTGNWREREQEFNRVTYDQHMWALITFRNPQNLYNFG